MIARKENGWELWIATHPESIGCTSEGREACSCQFHLVDEKRTLCLPFDSLKEADAEFCKRAGVKSIKESFITRKI